jgi:predicted phosphate transport protein (TIGR00153 family)
MLGRKIVFPASMTASIQRMQQLSIDAAAKAKDAISELDELLETGFSGNEITVVQDLLDELNTIESESDAAQVEIRAHLMGLESELPPVDVMFLYRIIDLIGDIADVSQRIGNRLLLLASK